MEELGQLKFVEDGFDAFEIFYANGHTDAQMIPVINYQDKRIAFMADLLPSAGHIPLAYVMGYDTRPLLTLEEKRVFLNRCADENIFMFLEHDASNEIITVEQTEKGVRFKETFKFNQLF